MHSFSSIYTALIKTFPVEKSNLINEHVLNREPVPLMTNYIQSTPDNSNLQGKSKKVRVIGSSSYRELEENRRE